MFLAAITMREKELMRDLDDEEVGQVAAKEVKKRAESIEAFRAAGREELAAKEEAEMSVIEPYAPKKMSEEEAVALVEEAISSTGVTSAKEMGKAMGYIMGKAKGQIDGTVAQRLLRERLSE